MVSRWLIAALAAALLGGFAPALQADQAAQPSRVTLEKTADGWRLLRNGQPYFIKGAGGGGSKILLAQYGGNSFRTWGVGGDTQQQLDEAQRLGLTVTLGIWLGHKESGFDYNNPEAVAKQMENARAAVEKYKNHPALLMWAMGNEMEAGNDTPALWHAIEDLARMVHQIDPNHPVMTVVQEIGARKATEIHQYCPDLDVIGINSYGGGPSLIERYRRQGGTKPIVITEFGPPGTWEIRMDDIGAPDELTSTAKAEYYRQVYDKTVLAAPDICLGSYVFTWGFKIEATSTWYGMFLPDGSRLGAVDVMSQLWTGKPVPHPCPQMNRLQLLSPDRVAAGETVRAAVQVSSPDGSPLKIDWKLYKEQSDYGVQGTGAAATPDYPDAIAENGKSEVTVKIPRWGGMYRIYCYVHDDHGGAAVGSLPVLASGPAEAFKAPVAQLPLVVYASGHDGAPFIPSGWMGDMKAINLNFDCSDRPRPGENSSLKVEFNSPEGWGSVIWQSPANDWGSKPGGFDLSRATRLTFWARGATGGETVTFGYGIIGKDKPFHDTSKAKTEITLTNQWKQYEINLSGEDLSCIKSGFYWNVHATGEPLAFYLDDIKYE